MLEHALSKGLAKSRRKVSRCRTRVELATVLSMRDPADLSPLATPLYSRIKIDQTLFHVKQAREMTKNRDAYVAHVNHRGMK